MEDRLDALEAEVKVLRANLEHLLARYGLKWRPVPAAPETLPRKEPAWEGSERCGCPTKE